MGPGDFIEIGGVRVILHHRHFKIAQAIYAARPFVVGFNAPLGSAPAPNTINWASAPEYYQIDTLEIAHAILPVINSLIDSALRAALKSQMNRAPGGGR